MSGHDAGAHRHAPEGHAAHEHGEEAWEDRVTSYDQLADLLEPEMRHATEALLDAVQARPGTRLLDLACGPGHTTEAARLRGADALGVDLTRGMVAAARRHFPHARFALGDMLDPPKGPWDAVTCRLGAHHVDPSWMRAAYGVLAPGGHIAIAEMSPTDDESLRNGMKPPAHWSRSFEEAGFVEVTVETRMLRLGALAAREAAVIATRAIGHHHRFQGGPVFIIHGQRPGTPS